jgi:hypothetical protein
VRIIHGRRFGASESHAANVFAFPWGGLLMAAVASEGVDAGLDVMPTQRKVLQ